MMNKYIFTAQDRTRVTRNTDGSKPDIGEVVKVIYGDPASGQKLPSEERTVTWVQRTVEPYKEYFVVGLGPYVKGRNDDLTTHIEKKYTGWKPSKDFVE